MVIPFVEDLALKLELEIVLFMTVEEGSTVSPVGGDGAYKIIPFSKEQMESRKAEARAYLETIAKGLRSKGITTKSEVTVGDAAKEIIKLGDRIVADLVAMSAHGRSGIGRWAFGSVANRILREGNNHLLLLRTEGPVSDN